LVRDAGRRGIPRGLCLSGAQAGDLAFGAGGGEIRAGSLKAAVLTCLAFTFLNPHVYLDTVLLVGGLSGRYEGTARLAFAIGAMSASFLWFFGLGYGARVLEPLFAKPSAWRVLDGLIALVMAALSVSLIYRFLTG
jgi:L-lysine exporter family protein LysE/ArgO